MEKEQPKWKRISKGEKLPCWAFLMTMDGMTTNVTAMGVTVAQDAYYLPSSSLLDTIKDFPKEECELTREDIDTMALEYVKKINPTLSELITKESLRASYYLRGEYDTYRQGLIDMYNKIKK